ncbi:helix-turn-helix transcriptional regulator [Acinetobacter sp. B51(2017)]|uniref:AraC family transcriptional regulator n=1 Tax=Acinetobacter sp. B51(2017) TaxID=2060938 RepID=UPI000F08AF7A|nr:helix-turn-helix transcriptional regulator [Acinetobacter sp. B51(2017)]
MPLQQYALGKQLPTNDLIAAPLWIDFRHDPAASIYPAHGHAWGEFIYAFDGVMQVSIQHTDYITPPPYGIWLPPHLEHSGLNRTEVSHATLYVHESLCHALPKQAGILLTSPLVNAVLQHLKQHPDLAANEHLRLLQVLLDQLQHAPLIENYLPHSQHAKLQPVLRYLEQYLHDQSSLKDLAVLHHMTERTLARYAKKELGMSIHEWRQRLKVMTSLTLLNQGKTVESIALDLGYSNASSFIQMFKRWMHISPDQFRKH